MKDVPYINQSSAYDLISRHEVAVMTGVSRSKQIRSHSKFLNPVSSF